MSKEAAGLGAFGKTMAALGLLAAAGGAGYVVYRAGTSDTPTPNRTTVEAPAEPTERAVPVAAPVEAVRTYPTRADRQPVPEVAQPRGTLARTDSEGWTQPDGVDMGRDGLYAYDMTNTDGTLLAFMEGLYNMDADLCWDVFSTGLKDKFAEDLRKNRRRVESGADIEPAERARLELIRTPRDYTRIWLWDAGNRTGLPSRYRVVRREGTGDGETVYVAVTGNTFRRNDRRAMLEAFGRYLNSGDVDAPRSLGFETRDREMKVEMVRENGSWKVRDYKQSL